jgi:hypothetical protein
MRSRWKSSGGAASSPTEREPRRGSSPWVFGTTEWFGSLVPRLIQFPKNSVLISSSKHSVLRVFGIGSFGSVTVYTKDTEPCTSCRMEACKVQAVTITRMDGMSSMQPRPRIREWACGAAARVA